MIDIAQLKPASTLDVLQQIHAKLDIHFRGLHEARMTFGPDTPVFALEHGLDEAELHDLQTYVRAAVAQGFGIKFRKTWLPFVVYAAESGYGYAGYEYWQTFTEQTPMWNHFGDRDRIRAWFMRFADDYAGVRPKGAFARTFPIIAWPITHAVLPTYLQRNLAELLFDFRTGLTSELLGDPEELGRRLGARASNYTERFRIFCENTTLLGSVATALLGDTEESPLLLRSTLTQLVEDLSREHASRQWLASARRSASRVRARGFVPPVKVTPSGTRPQRLPAPTDPKLLLKRIDGRWRAFVALPDLTLLNARLPQAYEELSDRRAWLEGKNGSPLPRTQLLRTGQEVWLTTWPRSDVALIQLDGGSAAVNQLLADQCVLTPGPVWLFKRAGSGPAIEVKGRVVRPGGSYVVVARGDSYLSQVAWVSEVEIEAIGVRAFELSMPTTLTDADVDAVRTAGLSVIADVAIRPVGTVASAWDGEGSIEWLVGEPSMLGIHSQVAAANCVLTLDGQMRSAPWPENERELFVVLDDLTVGTHELSVVLLAPGAAKQHLTGQKVFITILDPPVRPEGATAGEGIRLLVSPALPRLNDLFDKRATVSIDGPPGSDVEVVVTLRGSDGAPLAEIKRAVKLPRPADRWPSFAAGIRDDKKFRSTYDEAESAIVSVSRLGIGFATLTCDRGFQPLRWRIVRRRDGSFIGRLVDRTDGTATKVELFTVDAPLQPVFCQPDLDIEVSAHGGLLRATTGDFTTATILPTQPNKIRTAGAVRAVFAVGSKTPHEVLRLVTAYQAWDRADLPADAFAKYQQERVVDAIGRAVVSHIAGNRWASLETRLADVDRDQLIEHLDDLQKAVGIEPRHVALAGKVAHRLWEWKSAAEVIEGFSELIGPTLQHSGLSNLPRAALFLLFLGGRPGELTEWNAEERTVLLDAVIKSPVLMRVARFTVLGARAYNDADETAKGFL